MGKVHGSLARAGKVRGQTRGRAHKRMQYNRRFVTAGNSISLSHSLTTLSYSLSLLSHYKFVDCNMTKEVSEQGSARSTAGASVRRRGADKMVLLRRGFSLAWKIAGYSKTPNFVMVTNLSSSGLCATAAVVNFEPPRYHESLRRRPPTSCEQLKKN